MNEGPLSVLLPVPHWFSYSHLGSALSLAGWPTSRAKPPLAGLLAWGTGGRLRGSCVNRSHRKVFGKKIKTTHIISPKELEEMQSVCLSISWQSTGGPQQHKRWRGWMWLFLWWQGGLVLVSPAVLWDLPRSSAQPECHCTVAAEPQRPVLAAVGEVGQFRCVSSGPWPATGLLAAQDRVHPCAQRDRHCGKGGSSAFSFLQRKVSPSLAVGMQLCSFCFLFLSFSLCSAKIVSVTHLYPAGKVTCGQCCETPGGSCGCHTEMTYVKVTKYTQKLWKRKVWFQRKLSRAA